MVQNLDIIASTLTKIASWSIVSRSRVAQIALERGVDSLKAEVITKTGVSLPESPIYFSGTHNGKKVEITRSYQTSNDHTLVLMTIEGDSELWHDLASKTWDKYPSLGELRARVLEHLLQSGVPLARDPMEKKESKEIK